MACQPHSLLMWKLRCFNFYINSFVVSDVIVFPVRTLSFNFINILSYCTKFLWIQNLYAKNHLLDIYQGREYSKLVKSTFPRASLPAFISQLYHILAANRGPQLPFFKVPILLPLIWNATFSHAYHFMVNFRIKEILILHSTVMPKLFKGPCKLKPSKEILITNGRNYHCSVTFKISCQTLKTLLLSIINI